MGRPFGTKIGRIRFLSDDELERFLRTAKRAGVRKHLMMSMTYYYGLRVSELVGIRMSDINLPARQITIRGLKKGMVRTYDIPPKLLSTLQHWLRRRPAGSDWLFPSRMHPSEHVGADAAKELFKNLLAQAGLTGHSIHDLRSSRAQRLAAAGDGLPAIAAWLRHRSLGSSLRYLTIAADKRHEAAVAERDSYLL
jgi:type 1 fimbriae regulatory protein FimB